MARTPDLARRRELLDALFDEFAARGIGDRSLRDVAAAVGTSHRMLLHYFGSRDDLLIAIVEEAERRQMALVPDLPADPTEGFAAMWADLRRPELRRLERLFFECYSRAAQGEKPFTRMVSRCRRRLAASRRGIGCRRALRRCDGTTRPGRHPRSAVGSGGHQRRCRSGRGRAGVRRLAPGRVAPVVTSPSATPKSACRRVPRRWCATCPSPCGRSSPGQ